MNEDERFDWMREISDKDYNYLISKNDLRLISLIHEIVQQEKYRNIKENNIKENPSIRPSFSQKNRYKGNGVELNFCYICYKIDCKGHVLPTVINTCAICYRRPCICRNHFKIQ